MSETPSQQRTTPVRRQNCRQGARPAAHKAYASENDATTLEAARRLLHTPQTPSKANIDSNTTGEFSSKRVQGSKSRTKNKPRPKLAPTSPDVASTGGRTPPNPSVSIKSGMNTAFAGATFHASPAPSALPIPSFLSKSSVIESPVATGRRFTEEPSPPTTDQDMPTPFRASSVPRTNESPLDFMFRAHREEKERHFREIASGRNQVQGESPRASSPLDVSGLSKSRSLPQAKRSSLRPQLSGIDAFELDGTPCRPLGPAFSTPYQERIKAARAATMSSSLHTRPPTETSPNNPPTDDSTDALKKFLFGKAGPLHNNGPASAPTETHFPPSVKQDNSTSVPRIIETRSRASRGDNIEAMENDLRRILKLDVTSNAPSSDRIF